MRRHVSVVGRGGYFNRWAALAVAAAAAPLLTAQDVYWSNDTSPGAAGIWRADADGSNSRRIIPIERPYRLQVDARNDWIFWKSSGLGIYRARLDGSEVENIIPSASNSTALTLDARRGHLYWSRGGQVYRSDVDGASTMFIRTAGEHFQDLAFDPVHDQLYMSDWRGSGLGTLRRMNLDGTELANVVTNIEDGPVGVAVDAAEDTVFFARFELQPPGLGSIVRARLDGGGVETLIDDVNADAVALVPDGGPLYFNTFDVQTFTGTIARVNRDGSGHFELPLGTIQPAGLAVTPEPATALLLASLTALSLRRPRRPL